LWAAEVNAVTKEREALKKEVARLSKGKQESRKKKEREKKKKKEEKEQREEPVEHSIGATTKEQEEANNEEKDLRSWLLRSLSSELDEVIFQRFEQQQAKARQQLQEDSCRPNNKETDQGQEVIRLPAGTQGDQTIHLDDWAEVGGAAEVEGSHALPRPPLPLFIHPHAQHGLCRPCGRLAARQRTRASVPYRLLSAQRH
jgi:hypothetical protein